MIWLSVKNPDFLKKGPSEPKEVGDCEPREQARTNLWTHSDDYRQRFKFNNSQKDISEFSLHRLRVAILVPESRDNRSIFLSGLIISFIGSFANMVFMPE